MWGRSFGKEKNMRVGYVRTGVLIVLSVAVMAMGGFGSVVADDDHTKTPTPTKTTLTVTPTSTKTPTSTNTPSPTNTPTPTGTSTPTPTNTPSPTPTPTIVPMFNGLQYCRLTQNNVGVTNILKVTNLSNIPGRVRFSAHWWLWGWIYWLDIFDQWVEPFQTVDIDWIPTLPYFWDLKLWVGYFPAYPEVRVYDWQVFLPSDNRGCYRNYLPIVLR